MQYYKCKVKSFQFNHWQRPRPHYVHVFFYRVDDDDIFANSNRMYTAVQSQRPVSAYYTSKQIQPFGFVSCIKEVGCIHVHKMDPPPPPKMLAGPDGSFVSTSASNLEVPDSNHGRTGYLSSWLCIYSVPNCSISPSSGGSPGPFSLYVHKGGLKPDSFHFISQTVQRPGVYSAAYGTVHYKEPLKSFGIRVGDSPGFALLSVTILPRFYRKQRKAIFTHSYTRC